MKQKYKKILKKKQFWKNKMKKKNTWGKLKLDYQPAQYKKKIRQR